MGWVNSPPAFCAATETSADLANASIQEKGNPPLHTFDALASEQDNESKREPSLDITKIARDPCLPKGQRRKLLQYVDMFVDDFLGLAQGRWGKQRVRRILMKAINDVFRLLDFYNELHRRDPISIKKLEKGDCSWSTLKVMLGWIIDPVNMTIALPPHHESRLGEILSEIPRAQKRISVKNGTKC